MNTKKIPYYLIAAGMFMLLKWAFTIADNDNLLFLLQPTDKLVGLMTGSHSVYVSESGFYHEKLHILIEKSCSGFNFWLLSFSVFTFLCLKYFDRPLHKILTIPTVFFGTYWLTVFVNASRIFAAVVVQTQADNFLPKRPHLLLHEAVGIITNLSFLVLIYFLIEKFLNKQHNAKSA